jgi:hypothetical protein
MTLHKSHVLYALTGLYPEQTPHPLSLMSISPRQANITSGPLIEVAMYQPMPNKVLILLPDKGVPGHRLLDLFHNRFFHYPTDKAAKDPVRTQIVQLDKREFHAHTFPSKVVICITASSPPNVTLAQPVVGACIYHLGKLISSVKRPGGISTPQDCIIQALHLGICKALTLLPNLSFIQVFMTNLLAMNSALRADVGSNQSHRIAIANALLPG